MPHRTPRLLLLLAGTLLLSCMLTGCGAASRKSMALSAVNTSRVKVAAASEHDEGEHDDNDDDIDPMVYQGTVYSGEAFAIIDNLSPRCTACHRISTQGNARGAGPSLNGLRDHAGEREQGLSDREYIKQSIVDPSAYIVDECPTGPCVDVMVKNYHEQLSNEDIDKLVSFLLSLEADS